MGYNTSYKLKVLEGDRSLIALLRQECEDAEYALDDYGQTEDDTKWYDHHDDMLKFSKVFPEALFELYGEGEEQGDVWKKYYQNGKSLVIRAKVTFEDFDKSKME